MFNPVRNPSDNQADGQAAKRQVRQAYNSSGDRGSLVLQHHRDAEFERKQAGSVIHQALAFNQ